MSKVKALNVQFSLFPSVPGKTRADQIFERVFGNEADETQSNKTVTPQKNFLSLATSQAVDVVQSVRVLPGRVDLQITPKDRADSPEGLTTVDAVESLEVLLAGVSGLPEDGAEYLRLSVVCNVIERQKDLASANARIADLAGLKMARPDSLDLMVQMNRRKKIAGDIEINRVVQYSCLQVQSGQFHVIDGQLRPASVVESYGSSVAFDFNTAPGDYVLTSEGVFPIFSEIAALLQDAIKDLRLSSVLEIEGEN